MFRFPAVTLLLTAVLLNSGCPATGAEPSQVAKLEDLAWLVGTWKSPAGEAGPASEETWSTPAAGAMMGMFRMHQNDRVIIYEFLMLEQSADGITMRLRHFRPEMAAVEDVPIRLLLKEHAPGKLVFENPDNETPAKIVYATDPAGHLTVTVTTIRGDRKEEFALRFNKSE